MIINSLSSNPVHTSFLYVDATPVSLTTAYEQGGLALNNPSQGLTTQLWRMDIVGNDLVLSQNGANPQVILTAPGITEVSFTFDQNMNIFVAYVKNGQAYYYWYDGRIPGYTTVALPAGSISPRVTLDDKRPLSLTLGQTDINLAYVRNNNLYCRAQREDYATEHLLQSGVNGKLIKMNMNVGGRVQFMLQQN